MNVLLLLALSAQLPFAATVPTRSMPQRLPLAAAQAIDLGQQKAYEEAIRQVEATTQSVMIRHGGARTGDRSQDDAMDAQVVQAAFNQESTGANKSAGSNTSKSAQKQGTVPPYKGLGSTESSTGARDAQSKGPASSAADAGAPRSTTTEAARSGSPPTGQPGGATMHNDPAASGASSTFRSGATVDDTTRAAANASAALLSAALTAPSEEALEGRPVSLADVVGHGANPTQRLELASLYWKLALAIADYDWAIDESRQLQAVPGNPGATDATLLAAARAAVQARLLEAKAVVVMLQQELADAIGQSASSAIGLPLTVEQPLVGPYRTEFDAIFASRAAPGRARAIDRGLPLWREAIDMRAAAVQAATSGVETAEEAYAKDAGRVETLLFAHRDLSHERRAFLNAVREYNANIVEYASYVSGPATSAATIVSMLTRSKSTKAVGGSAQSTFGRTSEPTVANPLADPDVRRASAEEDAEGQWQGIGSTPADGAARGGANGTRDPSSTQEGFDRLRE